MSDETRKNRRGMRRLEGWFVSSVARFGGCVKLHRARRRAQNMSLAPRRVKARKSGFDMAHLGGLTAIRALGWAARHTPFGCRE